MSNTFMGASVLVYLCHHPDEELTLKDIQAKFGVGAYRSQTASLLARYVAAGWIAQENRMVAIRPSIKIRKGYYSAGPRLLAAIKQYS